MTFVESISTCLSKYATFQGRASRSEYWWWGLFACLSPLTILGAAYLVPSALVQTTGPRSGVNFVLALVGFYPLVLIVPCIAVASRRLHDIGKSGWWQLITLVPLVGGFILIFWLASKGEGENEYGPALHTSR